MITVQRSYGRLVVATFGPGLDQLAVLRFQQDLSAVVRRLGDPALLIVDLRAVGGLDPDVARMLQAMLGGGPLVLRQVVLPGGPGSFGVAFAESIDADDARRRVVRGRAEAVDALAGIATPAELRGLGDLFEVDQAA